MKNLQTINNKSTAAAAPMSRTAAHWVMRDCAHAQPVQYYDYNTYVVGKHYKKKNTIYKREER